MQKKYVLVKLAILMILFVSFSTVTMVGYSYWDNVTNDQTETVGMGDWGIALTTPQEFYDFATKTNSSSTDLYYLFNDIDFTEFIWEYTDTSDVSTFKGILDGNGKTLSNLTIYSNSSTYLYAGIFARLSGASIYNLVLNNVNISLGSNVFTATKMRSGLIAGQVRNGLTSTISNITIINSSVRGTSSTGVGGLVGSVVNTSTILNIENVKTTNLKVFSTSGNVGGLVGFVRTLDAEVHVTDVDVDAEVFSASSTSSAGGIIGKVLLGASFSATRAIVSSTSQNTLETDPTYYLLYSQRNLGGFVGYSQSSSTEVFMTDAFYTGSLYTNKNAQGDNVGTAIGKSDDSETLTRTFYSMVEFRSTSGTSTYIPQAATSGVMATLVNSSTMPSVSWWNGFATEFYSSNSLWAQDAITGRLYLLR